jgi:hypothetical protein
MTQSLRSFLMTTTILGSLLTLQPCVGLGPLHYPPPYVSGSFVRVNLQGGVVSPTLNPQPRDQGLHSIWLLPFDLPGICGSTRSLPSRQHSSPGHCDADFPSMIRWDSRRTILGVLHNSSNSCLFFFFFFQILQTVIWFLFPINFPSHVFSTLDCASRSYVTTGFNILNFNVVLRGLNLKIYWTSVSQNRLDVFLFHLVIHDILKILK